MNGTALRAVCLLKGISMTEAAAMCGIALTTLSGLAAGDHRASDKTIRSIADGLGVADGALFPELAGFVAKDDVEAAA